jgi:hypothetical protein
MLILGEQQLEAMSVKDLVRHVRAIESEEEVKFKHSAEALAAMTRGALVRRALEVQAEIARQRAIANQSKVR